LYRERRREIIGRRLVFPIRRGEMTVTDLYEAYAGGRITRGAFIRRLAGFGMSVAVAAAYADALARPSTARADGPGAGYSDYYNFYSYYDLYHP
jgi:hypothetical protein